MPFGIDDMLPHTIRKYVLDNMITAQCQQFNTICCYGQGAALCRQEGEEGYR